MTASSLKRPSTAMNSSRIWAILGVAAVGAIAFLVFARSMSVFFWREDFEFLDLANTMSFVDYLGFTFTPSHYARHEALLFRPLPHYVYYKMATLLFSLNPEGFHVINLLLHTANAILVTVLASKLTNRLHVGLISGTIYAVSRVNFEVFYVHLVGVADLLVAFFALVTVLSCMRESSFARRGSALSWLALAAYALALCSKENAIMIPALLIAYDLFFVCHPMKNIKGTLIYLARHLWPFAAISLVLVAIRLPAIQFGFSNERSMYRLVPSINAVGKYGWGAFWSLESLIEPVKIVKKTLLPNFHPLDNKPLAFGAAMICLMIVLLWFVFWIRRTHTRQHQLYVRVILFGLTWFLVMPVPMLFISGFAPYLFIPALIGLALGTGAALGMVIEELGKHTRLFPSGPLALLLMFAFVLSGFAVVHRIEDETVIVEYANLAGQAMELIVEERNELTYDSSVFMVGFPEQVFAFKTERPAVHVFSGMPLDTHEVANLEQIGTGLSHHNLVLRYDGNEVIIDQSLQSESSP